MRRALAAIAITALAARASGGDDASAKRREAIDRGIKFLRTQQATDGSWSYENLHPKLKTYPMLQGSTAIAALALMKSGVPPTDAAVKKAFAFVRAQPVEETYSAGLVLLMIEARLHWEPATEPSGATTTEPAKPSKSSKLEGGPDLDLARACVEFLEKSQRGALWGYKAGKVAWEDSSNAQYALLGLDAAERMGLPVAKSVYEKAQTFFIENQEKDGPDVKPFAVPGADLTIAELKAIEKETHERLAKIDRGFVGRKPGEPDAEGRMKEDLVRAAEEDAAKKIFKSQEKLAPMKARGFPYSARGEADERRVYGSMTASGVACLFICKAHLDGTAAWPALEPKVNRALRDGAAWLEHSFSVEKNPDDKHHLDYWLYALERAAILNLVPRFGKHDWYGEGCAALMKQQQADGSFTAGAKTTVGPVIDTCFALLFMSRGTTPLVKLPERIMTGQGAR